MGEPVVLQHGSEVWSLAVLPDRRLASGGLEGKIKLWLVDERKLLAALCLRAGRNFTNDEWVRYVGSDTPWRPSCQAFGLPSKLADAELRLIRVRKADTSAAQLPSGAAFGVTLIGPGNLFLDLEPERGRKHCIWVIFSMEVNLRNV